MAAALRHRGPDDGGAWADAACGVALGARRLAVVDLSQEGHQPMASTSGRWVLSYNGEVYNHQDLRRRLETKRVTFRGHSDTEVMLAAVETWGLAQALARLNGMFALALWDRRERKLHLVRDRLGEKPLYYGWQGPVFLFGSELKALRRHPDFSAQVDRRVLALYLSRNCVPAPHAIYAGVAKLPPGTSLTIGATEMATRRCQPVPYWTASAAVEAGAPARTASTAPDLVDELEELLREAVGLRMEADVPVGAFLSGGTDSSLVAALMQAQSRRPVRTFTVGFEDRAYDESSEAAAVARHLGTDHVELRVSAADALGVIPELPVVYDEPFADSSQIPTFLVSRLARHHVTVCLSGDGGDELFGGYNRYVWSKPTWERINRLPLSLRRAAAGLLAAPPPGVWDSAFQRLGPLLPAHLRVRNPGTKVTKLASVLGVASIEEMYARLASQWADPASLVVGLEDEVGLEGKPGPVDPVLPASLADPVEAMMYLDLTTYLHDDILTKLDRASMAVSLEARVPLLDHRVVEMAWRLPLEAKLREGQTKWLLRQVLYRHVPPALIERPKMGFGLPVGTWLRGPLRPWAEDLLAEGRLRREGFFHPAPIRTAWQAHLSGRREAQYELWGVLMFQAWLAAAGR